MQYNLAKSTVIAVMKKTDQEIIVSRKHKSGLEIGVKLKTRLMTTKNVHGDV